MRRHGRAGRHRPPQAAETSQPAAATVIRHVAREKKLTVGGLAAVAYFTCSGGPFGLEPLISAVGPGYAVMLILVSPVVWSAPLALMSLELTTMMPEEGGYYVWVSRAIGRFWGVQEAWWSLWNTIALMAVFVVLFVTYLGYFVPSLSAPTSTAAVLRWFVATGVVVTGTWVNLRGAKEVGRSALIGATLVAGTFIVFGALGLAQHADTSMQAIRTSINGVNPSALLIGLSILVFNFSGWDNVSTFAAEVDEPQRTYPRALALAMIIVCLAYLLPVLAGLGMVSDRAYWTADAGWPAIGRFVGGPLLGALFAALGMVSMWSMYVNQLLYASRLPLVLAVDGFLPAPLARVASAAAVPTNSILVIAGIVVLLVGFSFDSLAVLSGILYTAALALEFISLVVLRIREPEARRPFRVPGGTPGLVLVCIGPVLMAAGVLAGIVLAGSDFWIPLVIVACIIATGSLVFAARRARPGATTIH